MADAPPVYVWVWLPDATEPVVAGRLDSVRSVHTFTYGRSYLKNPGAIALFTPDLPLMRGPQVPTSGPLAGVIADSLPDAWGRRVLLNRLVGHRARDVDALPLSTYLLESGTDRIGAIDFQRSPRHHIARASGAATLAELLTSAERVQQGVPLSGTLDRALLHGSSIGGARPKALLSDGNRRLIAKFASASDPHPVVQGEFVAMELARRVGLSVAPVELVRALGRDVLLIERFDRPGGDRRRLMVSALTMLGLDEMIARYASYADLAAVIRARFTDPTATLRELFSRIIFNILVGNTDDHARNHAAFWNGSTLTLTPAYDICPQVRGGNEAQQIMAIGDDGWRMSQVAGCIDRAHTYLLGRADARLIAAQQIATIRDQWGEVCDLARLAEVDRRILMGRQILNPYCLEGFSPS